MQIITTWPDKGALNLTEDIYYEAIRHLIEGFDSEDLAKQYWQDIPTVFIHLTADDNHSAVGTMSDEVRGQIQFALDYPEFVVPIGEDYQLALAVFSDEGSGIYLLIHNNCPLCQELADV
ncbi:hypothetical protein [Neptuniibacter sp.]|uniref:hypothetical protein n=1 Tax=Neptuniibacter sp. TaxID=1962643 RepID=UPI002622EC87|nr:hypothetical protein [Neptuniibacter sp.]